MFLLILLPSKDLAKTMKRRPWKGFEKFSGKT
jgi:hypothetical protein